MIDRILLPIILCPAPHYPKDIRHARDPGHAQHLCQAKRLAAKLRKARRRSKTGPARKRKHYLNRVRRLRAKMQKIGNDICAPRNWPK